MARDPSMEQLVRDDLRMLGVNDSHLIEKGMFGAWVWMFDGNLLCGAERTGILYRLGKGNDAWALTQNGVCPMSSGSRRMPGWVTLEGSSISETLLRHRLLQGAIDFVGKLPPKWT